MALLEEMQVLVDGLEAAFSRRLGAEQERRVTAAQDASDRAAEMAIRCSEVAETLSGLHRDRVARAAEEAYERATAERERQAAAMQDAHERAAGDRVRRKVAGAEAHERAAQILGLGRIWRDHAAALGSFRGGAFHPPVAATARQRPAAAATRRRRSAAATTRQRPVRAAAGATRKPAAQKPAAPVTAAAILSYLAGRPGGVKLGELQAHWNSPRMALVRILNEMIADKKVRKDAKLRLYFAV